MNSDSLEFFKALLQTYTPSGYESEGQKLWKKRTGAFCDSIKADVHGNIIVCINSEAPTRIMLAGHCDEIGLMVTHITDEGFIHFASVGGIDASVLPGSRVTFFQDGGITGVIGRKPIHLLEKEERGKSSAIKDLWIDIGAKNKKDALKHLRIGSAACITAHYSDLLNGLVASKGMDDKTGAFVVSETMRLLHERRNKLKVAVYGVSTVQEELGLRGAITSGYGIKPDAAIAVDVGFASDGPDGDKKTVGDVKLGKGPILHRGAGSNTKLLDQLEAASKRGKITVQWCAEPSPDGTDAGALQISRSGVASALVSIPLRYMHTPVEVCAISDVKDAADLIAETLLAMPAKTSFVPY
jgi:tetrahedral aminopeptidase